MTTNIVEYLRNKMVHAVDRTGAFTHPDVVQISQRLDTYIAEIQRQSVRDLWYHQDSGVISSQSTLHRRLTKFCRHRASHLRPVSMHKTSQYRGEILH